MKKKLHTTFWAIGILVLVTTQLLAFAPASYVSAAPITLETIKDETYKYSVYAAMHACLNRVSTSTSYYGPEDWDGPLSMDTVIVGFAGSDGGNNDGYVNCDEAGKLWMNMAGHANVSDMMSQFGFTKSSQRCSTAGTSGQQSCVETWTTNNKGAVLGGHDKIAKSKGIPTALPTGGRYTLAVSALDAKCQSSGPTITTTGNRTAATSTVTIISDNSGVLTNKSYVQSSDNDLGVWPTTNGGDKSSCSYLIDDVNKTAKAASATMVAERVGQTATDLSKTACEKAGVTGAKLKTCLSDFAKWSKACITDYYANNPTALGGGTFDADAIASCIIAKNGGEGIRGKYNITKADLAVLVKGAMDSNTPAPATGADNTKDPCSVLPEDTQMKWLACSMLLSFDGILTALYGTIQSMLVTPNEIFEKPGFIAATSVFRNFGLALLVIAGLIMIIAQASGSDLVDAYTVKKVLPRIGVALVGIALAIPLLRLAVIFTNDIGILIGNLMGSIGGVVAGPTAASGGGAEGLGAVMAWIIGGGGAGLYLMVFLKGQGTIALAGTIILALIVGLVVLTIRQLVIVVLILLAPLAIASSILPGTEKLWKYWRSTLLTTLAMFPIIMLFLSSGKFMASIFGTMNNGLFAVLAYFAPYFMLPFAFKLAGGLMGNIFQAVQGRASKGFEAFKGMRKKAVSSNAEEFMKGNGLRGPLKNTSFGRAIGRTGLATNALATGELGFDARKWGERLSSASSRQSLEAAHEALEKQKHIKSIAQNDDFAQVALDHWMDEDKQREALRKLKKADGTQVYSEQNISEGIATIRMGQRAMTKESFENAMLLALPGTGTAWKQKFDKDGNVTEGGAGAMRSAINRVVGDDRIRGAMLLSKMKAAADQAGRSDLAGASFSEDLAIMDAMYLNQTTPGSKITFTQDDGQVVEIAGDSSDPEEMNLGITKHYNKRVLETKGAGQLIGGLRAHAFQGVATALRDRLDEVGGVSGDDRVMKKDTLKKESFIRELGVHAGMLDAAGQSSPEKQRIIADTVFGKVVNIEGKDTTYAEIIDKIRNDPDYADMAEVFAETRREYGSRYAREAADAARLTGMGDLQQQ